MRQYILTILILDGLYILIGGNSSKENKNKTIQLNNIIISFVMMIWGSIELWDVECVDELNHTLLYRMVRIHVISSFVLLPISLIYYIMIIYFQE